MSGNMLRHTADSHTEISMQLVSMRKLNLGASIPHSKSYPVACAAVGNSVANVAVWTASSGAILACYYLPTATQVNN
jgi:hypothetical protein